MKIQIFFTTVLTACALVAALVAPEHHNVERIARNEHDSELWKRKGGGGGARGGGGGGGGNRGGGGSSSNGGRPPNTGATLKELYGSGVEKIKIDARVFQTSSNRKLEFNIVASNYHLEITPSDVGNYDRVVVQDLLKEVAQTQQVDQAARQRFKVVVINEADHLTRDAQAALRRTMEKYSPNLRLILLANSTANIIAPIRSRTLLVRVAAPTHAEICDGVERGEGVEGEGVQADGGRFCGCEVFEGGFLARRRDVLEGGVEGARRLLVVAVFVGQRQAGEVRGGTVESGGVKGRGQGPG
ncbi:Replication factor C subunit 5 like protein [Verticillium longisporum]|nr:Replication factor C subunit 5 like protein [Verticillium longisporum]